MVFLSGSYYFESSKRARTPEADVGNEPPARYRRVVTRCLGVAVCLAALVAAGSGGAARLAPAQAAGVVVFTGERLAADGESSSAIYAVNLDGTGLTRLTRGPGASPVPSPDGRLIAFDADDGLAVMNRDGSGQRNLKACSTPVSWAPDSRRFTCSVSGDGIAVVDVAAGSVTKLSPSGDNPAWSPDGRSIAYTDSGLWVVDVQTGKKRRLSRRETSYAPSWSPDSRSLAYIASVADGYDVFAARAEGSGERRVAKNVDALGPRAWSGSRIVLTRRSGRRPTDVYTVRADGTGLRRVSRGVGGEGSHDPSWSADGTLLVYAHERYAGGYDADIVVAAAGGGSARRLTAPFPVGGTNGEPRWLPGPRLPRTTPQRPPTMTLPLARTLPLRDPVQAVAADGARAAISAGGCPIVVWEPLRRRTLRMAHVCDEAGIDEVVLSGSRVAWTASSHGNTEHFTELRAASIGGRRARIVSAGSAFSGDGESPFDSGANVWGVRGGGGTIAFTFSRYGRSQRRSVWLVLSRRGAKCPGDSEWARGLPSTCLRLGTAGGSAAAAADAGRVLAASGGTLRLLTTSGRLLRTVRTGRAPDVVRLAGTTLAAQLGDSVTLYDTRTGAARRTWRLAAGEGAPRLLDAGARFVVYATGGAIHVLDTRTGRDRALSLPRGAPPFDARLTPSGLFVGWNRMYDPRPGRLSFVPLRALAAAARRR
jgi:Tol biopolymer transport system component